MSPVVNKMENPFEIPLTEHRAVTGTRLYHGVGGTGALSNGSHQGQRGGKYRARKGADNLLWLVQRIGQQAPHVEHGYIPEYEFGAYCVINNDTR